MQGCLYCSCDVQQSQLLIWTLLRAGSLLLNPGCGQSSVPWGWGGVGWQWVLLLEAEPIKHSAFFFVVGDARCNNLSFTLKGWPRTPLTAAPKKDKDVVTPDFPPALWSVCVSPRPLVVWLCLAYLAPSTQCHWEN